MFQRSTCQERSRRWQQKVVGKQEGSLHRAVKEYILFIESVLSFINKGEIKISVSFKLLRLWKTQNRVRSPVNDQLPIRYLESSYRTPALWFCKKKKSHKKNSNSENWEIELLIGFPRCSQGAILKLLLKAKFKFQPNIFIFCVKYF